MPKVPRITGAEAIRAFGKVGYVLERVSGSHHILKRSQSATLSIPCHGNKTIGVGLLRAQIDAAGLTVEQFIELL
ncbi:MAG: type II toxin-antitoxin system HicA family toxin [Planctomycetaceae bacterium]|nr:type II toxin-antitoxin system HicA family toxin [Planctomycetaceae bacterium]